MIADRLREVLPAEGISEREGDGRTLPVASPAERTEWVELMRLAASESWRIFTLGGGTHTASVPGEADLLLSTSRIDRVLAFEPGDGTLTAEAGATMGALGSLCEAGGYHLAPDVPSPERATLGGAIASGAAGIDRLRYGPTRAVLLGLEVLSSEGTITRSGGRLVKNVTGYDLHRLHCGAWGSLGVILSASLRLLPLPRQRALVRVPHPTRAAAHETALALLREAIRPEALILEDTELHLFLAGREETVAYELERAAAHIPNCDPILGPEARAAWVRLRDARSSEPRLELSCRPTRLPRALDAVERAAADLGVSMHLLAHPGIATAHVEFRAADAGSISELDPTLSAPFANLRVAHRWIGTDLAVPVRPALPRSPAVVDLERRLTLALDPEERFVGGRP